MDNQNNCENCTYFLKHYAKTADGKLQRLYGEGHCINYNLKKIVSRKIIRDNLSCEYWSPEASQKEARRRKIEKELCAMKRRLDDIASILKDDEI